jgi:hypothetical protein
MALLSFVESAPRAYRLKVGNADLFRNSTKPGTSPSEVECRFSTFHDVGDHLADFRSFDGPVHVNLNPAVALGGVA